MNAIGKIVYFDVTEELNVFDLFLIFWLFGAFILVIRYIINRKKVYACLKPYILSMEEIKQSGIDFFSTLEHQNMRIACIPGNVVPSIFGTKHPIIILPKDSLSSKDLQFILRHELQHYRHYDLHLKVILDLLTAIYWWNPFVYSLRKKFNVAIEISNDYIVTKFSDRAEIIQYAESLLNVAKKGVVNQQYDLFLVEHSHIKDRICMLIDDAVIPEKRKRFSLVLNVMFITAVMTISLFSVPEADYSKHALDVFEEEGAFEITPENAYFVKDADEYELYLNGEYVTFLTEIPSELKAVPIYEKENTH